MFPYLLQPAINALSDRVNRLAKQLGEIGSANPRRKDFERAWFNAAVVKDIVAFVRNEQRSSDGVFFKKNTFFHAFITANLGSCGGICGKGEDGIYIADALIPEFLDACCRCVFLDWLETVEHPAEGLK